MSEKCASSQIAQTNFHNPAEVEEAKDAVSGCGYDFGALPLGVNNVGGETYRVLLRTHALVPDPPLKSATDQWFLDEFILGVKISPVSYFSHHSEESGSSSEKNDFDLDHGGFLFFQLGQLEEFGGDNVHDAKQSDH